MDLMSIRRGLMTQMASGKSLIHGEFTPTEDLTEYTIDIGKQITFFFVEVKNAVPISGRRNFGLLECRVENDTIAEVIGLAGNASGTGFTSNSGWSKISNDMFNAIVKQGNTFTFKPSVLAAGAAFIAGVTYEWYAY